jgi:hypothetical protein
MPRDYDTDAGVALTFDTLCDRGHDPERVREALDAFTGDLWWDVFGPAIDRAAEGIGLGAHPEDAAVR